MVADRMIECAGLVRIYTSAGVEVQALQGLDLSVDAGELVAIVGASGSGKSTLLGILSALDAPTAGAVRVAGRDLVGLTDRARDDFHRHDVGFVGQQTAANLLPYLTVEENISVVASLGTRDRAERRRRIAAVTDLLGLGEVRTLAPALLTGVQQQRAAIAVALVNEPSVLLADEPTGELDEDAAIEILEAMRMVNEERGVTTVIVTHDAGVSEHVRRTVLIRDGRTSAETLRTAERDAAGTVAHTGAREYAVLDRFGRLQLPEEYTAALRLAERVRLALEPDHIRIEPGGDTARAGGADAGERGTSAGSLRRDRRARGGRA